ncbi:unnamed protein product, partial [Ectocarpus fasciculatus]
MTDAAVGSISHILKTAFKDVYEDKRERDEYMSSSAHSVKDPVAVHEEGEGVAGEEAAAGADDASAALSQPSIAAPKAPKQRAIDTLDLGEHHKQTLAQRAMDISRELEEKNTKADSLVEHLAVQRAAAKEQRIREEEELKKQGIIIGQHIPPLPSKLDVDPAYLEQFGEFSSNLLVARELVSQNRENILRRTGNLPISEQLEQRKTERGKRQQNMESSAPHYLEQTASQNTRQSVTQVRFNESLQTHAQELTMKEPVVFKKRKKMLTAAERFENDAILKSINHKLNYLRNPRNNPAAVTKLLTKTRQPSGSLDIPDTMSAHSGGASSNQGGGSSRGVSVTYAASAPLFVAEPKRVLFNGFDIGNEYKKTITFRNVSAVSRTFRVLPPSTAQFTMSPLQYPQNSRGGVVAPGMSVTAQITFFPDSLLEFDDHIIVETEGGTVTVPILARRESPILTLPPVLNIGSCLVGDAMRTSIRCGNAGGPGKFQIVSFDEFERGLGISESVDCLRIPPFSIYPLEFSIDRNSYADFTIEFVPLELGESRGEFIILSDSGQSFRYTILANSLKTNVYICEINGTIVDPEDSSIARDLYFNSSYVGSHQTQKVHVANDTGLPVEYEWVWIDSKSKDVKRARGFEVQPARGVMGVEGVVDFDVSFSPASTDEKAGKLVLLLRRVTIPSTQDNDQELALENLRKSAHAFGSGKPCTVVVDPPRLIVGGSVSIGKEWKGSVILRNSSNVMADITLDHNNISVITHGHSDSYGKKENPSGMVECSVEPSHVLLLPESEITVDISLAVGTVGDYEIRIPAIPSHDLIYIDPITVYVRTNGPRLRFEEPDIDIGLMSTGLESRKTFTFTNESDVPLRYALTGAVDSKTSRKYSSRSSYSPAASASKDTDDGLSPGGAMLTSRSETSVGSRDSYTIENPTASVWYEPTAGVVQPNEHVTVTMVCMGGKLAQRLRGNIECLISDESGAVPLPMQLLPFRGEIQMPKAIISPVHVNIGTVFENVKVPVEVTLQNLSNLPSKYKFERPGGNSPLYDLDFYGDVRAGTLGPKEILTIKMSITAHKQGVISDAIACKIFGTPSPIGFGISAVVKALALEFVPLSPQDEIPLPLGSPHDCQYTGPGPLDDPAPTVPIEIGSKVKLYERKTIRFAIRNFSAIPADFSISPRCFGIGEVPGLEDSEVGFSKTIHRTEHTLLVPNEDGESKFHSEMGKEYVGASVKRQEDKAYLTLGKGASYAIEPRTGTVPPWGVRVVTVFARNDMPGCFDDEIMVDVSNYRQIAIPLSMTVEGCPLIVEKDTYGLTSKVDPETGVEKPLLLLGNLCKDEEAPERQFRIRNNGSVPTRIIWKVRSVTSKVNGPVKVELKLDQDLSVKSKFLFWDDLAKETPFLVDPSGATIPAYGSQTFRVKL